MFHVPLRPHVAETGGMDVGDPLLLGRQRVVQLPEGTIDRLHRRHALLHRLGHPRHAIGRAEAEILRLLAQAAKPLPASAFAFSA